MPPERSWLLLAVSTGLLAASALVLYRTRARAHADEVRDTKTDPVSAEQLERLREEWASVVAHDLRQPVNTILMTAELLTKRRGEQACEAEAKALRRIRTAACRLNRMIADLLDVSLIESQRMTIDRTKIRLSSLVEEVVERLGDSLTPCAVRIRSSGPEVLVWCDPERVEQIVGNLLSNAAKYGEPGTEVAVELDWLSDRVVVTVENRGRGILPEEAKLLFNRFVRSGETRRVKGLGLGLYICKGLVEAHGGGIGVDSSPGAVTRFHFWLPLQRSEAVPAERGRGPSTPLGASELGMA
jgi:signal transduction histidine kinase